MKIQGVRRFAFLRYAAVLAAAALLAGCAPSDGDQTAPAPAERVEAGTLVTGEEELAVENSRLRLTLDPATCAIEVTDKQNGMRWGSNPPADYEDPIAAGSFRTDIKSQLLVSYTTKENANVRQANSFAASVNKGDYRIYRLDNGFRVHYTFNLGFTIPVAYLLEEDSLNAMVLYDEIEEDGTNLLNTVSFLPYFGLAGSQDEGFMLIPDGSGALIRFNNGKTTVPMYEKMVYGDDVTLGTAIESSSEEQIRLPMFGMQKEAAAFAAVIESGDGGAVLQAAVSGQKTAFNTVYATGIYRVSSTIYMMSNDTGSRNVLYNAEEVTGAARLQIRYTFLADDQADLAGMAAVYRRRLPTGAAGTRPPALHVELTGGVSSTKSFLGFQYEGHDTLTSFDDAARMLEELHAAGVPSLSAGYRQYSADAFAGRVETTLKPAAAAGSQKQLARLLEAAAAAGDALYFHADVFRMQKTGNGVSRFFDVCKNVNLGAAEIQPIGFHTNIPDASEPVWYLVNPRRYTDLLEALSEAADDRGIDGLYFTDTAGSLAGDYGIGGAQRDEAKALLAAGFGKLAQGRRLLLADPNAYLYAAAAQLTDIPMQSSRHLLFDEDVPFVQMVLRGCLPYTARPMNMNGDTADVFLQQVETLSGLQFAFIAGDPSLLLRTDLIHEYSLSYDAWKASAVQYARALSAVSEAVGDARMTGYRREGELTVTAYENGVMVYVNHGQQDVTADGLTVGARRYLAVRDGTVVASGDDQGNMGA